MAAASNRYPNVDVTFEVEDSDEVSAGDSVTVVVNLAREGEEESRVPKVHAPHFPKEKEEGWWLVIGDPKTNALLCIKRITLVVKAKVMPPHAALVTRRPRHTPPSSHGTCATRRPRHTPPPRRMADNFLPLATQLNHSNTSQNLPPTTS